MTNLQKQVLESLIAKREEYSIQIGKPEMYRTVGRERFILEGRILELNDLIKAIQSVDWASFQEK